MGTGGGFGTGYADYLAIAPELQPGQGGRSVEKGRQTGDRVGGNEPPALCTGYRLAAWATPSVSRVQGSTGDGVCAGSHL